MEIPPSSLPLQAPCLDHCCAVPPVQSSKKSHTGTDSLPNTGYPGTRGTRVSSTLTCNRGQSWYTRDFSNQRAKFSFPLTA
eukprot:2482817-Rhodomonas_salina.1